MARPAGTSAGDTRARILDVALELVSERGYAGMSIRDLAEKLDLTTAAMYYHFASKEALLDALVAPFIEGLAEVARASASGELTNAEVLSQLVTLLSGAGARALPVLMSDPSASSHLKNKLNPMKVFGEILHGLAPSDDPLDLLRARCAMGTVQGAVMTCVRESRAHGTVWSGFDDEQHAVVVGAALAALHAAAASAVPVAGAVAAVPPGPAAAAGGRR